jgi:hypothetical protein
VAYNLAGNPKSKRIFQDVSTGGGIILKWILKKQGVRVPKQALVNRVA